MVHRRVGRPGAGGHQRVDDLGVDHRPAAGDLPDGGQQLVDVGNALFEQVAPPTGTMLEEGQRVLRVGVLAQEQDAGVGVALPHMRGGPHTLVGVGRGHPDVGQHDVGPLTVDGREQRREVFAYGDQLELRLGLDKAPDALADQVVVLRQDQPDGHPGRIGEVGGGEPHLRHRGHPPAETPAGALGPWNRGSYGPNMRIESSVTAISWIPSEAISGLPKLPFRLGVTHYDSPPPDVTDDLEPLRTGDRFRFANQLKAWIEVEEDRIVGWGHSGKGHIGQTAVRLGRDIAFSGVPFPEVRPEPEASEHAVRFVQTAGGRTGLPAPRRVRGKPFLQMTAPLAWSTLALTLRVDGSSEFEVLGASQFPRHWIYDGAGRLAAKTGMIDFEDWYRRAFAQETPWGDENSAALVTLAETALERQLSDLLMGGTGKPKVRQLKAGEPLLEQGKPGRDLCLLLDGVAVVEVDGESVAQIGPGAILGERSFLERGLRTATVRAVTRCKVATAPADRVDRERLAELATGHRRERHSSTGRP